MPMRAWLFFVALLLIAWAGAVGLVYAFFGNPLDPFDDRRFSQAAWARASFDERAAMARSVIRRLTPGLPETQVSAMLGPPDGVRHGFAWGSRERLPGARTYVYSLDSRRTFGYAGPLLYVHFDANDRVIGAEVKR